MINWVTEELALLRTVWPGLVFVAGGNWVMRKGYPLPDGWNKPSVDLAIRIPAQLPGEKPYGFWVRGDLLLANGNSPGSYTFPSDSVPFSPAEPWGKFSWDPEIWAPGIKPGEATGMVHFAMSINRRLKDIG
jgi:hypothetical protein